MRSFFCNVIIPFLLVSCTSASLRPDTRTSAQETGDVTAIHEDNSIIKGVVCVSFDDSTADMLAEYDGAPLTKASGLDSVPLDVTRMERVFPDAGEFEQAHRDAGLHKWYLVHFDSETPLTKATKSISSIAGIESVEELRKPETDSANPFNDPYAGNQWHLYNDGSLCANHVSGADINVTRVWTGFTGGDRKVIVGVIDTGVDATHPDLSDIVIPAGPTGSQSYLNSRLMDPYNITGQRHGTHVAGIIAAINNNGIGGCGIAGGHNGNGGVRILDCQAIASVEGDGGNTVRAITEAADRGAVIINNSWNLKYDKESSVPLTTSASFAAAINYFVEHAGCEPKAPYNQRADSPMKGGVVIFSAGNDSRQRSQPSMYESNISVGALGPSGEKSYYTNYGSWVDICAPGGDSSLGGKVGQIYSTVSGGGYDWMQGTSMAAPVVSGVAALLVSYFGKMGFTNNDLKELLFGGANYEHDGLSLIGPKTDAYTSFVFKSSPVPPTDNLLLATENKNNATLAWYVKEHRGEPIYAYLLAYGEDKSVIENLDPHKIPSDVTTLKLLMSGKKIGSRISRSIRKPEQEKLYYATVIGMSTNHQYSAGNTVVRFGSRSPIIESSIPDTVRLKPFESAEFSFHLYDPDSDELTIYTETGSDAATWSEATDGNITLTINGRNAPSGTYRAAIQVTDRIGLSKTVAVTYILLPNSAPVIVMVEPHTDPVKYKETAVIKVFCCDPDGDALSINTNPGSPAAIWAEAPSGHHTITIRGDAAPKGSYTASISVDDGFGGRCSMDIPYTLLGNKPVQLICPIDDTVFTTEKNGWSVDLSNHFTDPDGDTVVYGVESSSAYISALLQEGRLILTAASPAVGTITVRAGDGIAPPVTVSFMVSAFSKGVGIAEVYPQIVSDKLTVQAVSPGTVKVRIYSSTGRLVYSKELSIDPFTPTNLDLSGLAPGRYTVYIINSSSKHKQTIIKI